MAGNNLLSLVENIQTWDKLEKRIADLPTEMERGNAFEEFCHALFLLDPVFQFQQVYRHNEIPHSIRKRLGYPGIQDLGIDGVGTADSEDWSLSRRRPGKLIHLSVQSVRVLCGSSVR
jgi:hypothetical protein